MKYNIGDYVIIRNKVRNKKSSYFKETHYIYHNGNHTVTCKNPKPILLNKDLFTLIGFNNWTQSRVINKYKIIYALMNNHFNITIFENARIRSILINIKYLHELQQVFRTLTQKELINEKYDKALSSYKSIGDS